MIIGAMGDAHGGKYLSEAVAARARGVDLLLLAGDMAESNDLDSFARSYGLIREVYNGPVIAVFGNDEYEQDRPKYRERFDAIFLDDEAVELEVGGYKVRIVGTTGPLDRPTWWQRTHLPDVWKRYRERVKKAEELLERNGADLLIYLSHYAPSYLTLEGERPKAFPEMGSKALEEVLLGKRPDLVVHAHAHKGSRHAVLRKEQMTLDEAGRPEVPIWNVSLALTEEITVLEMRKEDGWHANLQG
jgi:Icc-related predicted phosphoesterase